MLHMSQMIKMSQIPCMGVHGYAWVCAGVCVCDEFSEYLLETRFLTSANYNPHPLGIFFVLVVSKSSELYKFPTDNSCNPERSMDVGQIRAKGNQSTLKFGEIGPTQVKC